MRESSRRAPQRARDNLSRLRRELEQRQEEVARNYQDVRKGLEADYRRAVGQLERLYGERITAVESDLLHVEMELERLDWMGQYLERQEQQLKPLLYFPLQQR